ncbi:IMC sub-compartment protein ISP1 [Cryptosporidium felis]|nr:IMC sub-compartment protein ISP1 [Cryptosporidium felis]
MLESIINLFQLCFKLKKNKTSDEYVFILCPAPSDLEEEYIDEEGSIKKKKLKKIRGRSRSIVDNGVVREWSGREIGSCICCHLIYEDEERIYMTQTNEENSEIIGEFNENKETARSVDSLNSESSKKEINRMDTNSTDVHSEKDESGLNEDESKATEKSNGKEDEKNRKDKMRINKGLNKNKSPGQKDIINDEGYSNSMNEHDKNEKKSAEPRDKDQDQDLMRNDSINKSLSQPVSSNKYLAKRPPLKNQVKHCIESKSGKKASQLLKRNITDTKVIFTKGQAKPNETKQLQIVKNGVSNISEKKKSHEGQTIIAHSETESEKNNSIDEKIYDEEEIKFNRGSTSNIKYFKEAEGIQAGIILKDGSIANCKLVFSDNDIDLSFICDNKIKAVPWNNIKELFTTKRELRMVNIPIPLHKDPALMVALHLSDTGNCIPLKFNSKQNKEDFLKFALNKVR